MLREHQQELDQKITEAWQAGHRNILATAACGFGKTVNMAHIVGKYQVPAICIAHREELVGQISCTLARESIPHRIVAPDKIIRQITDKHVRLYGASFYQPRSPYGVAGIDTLVRRDDPWFDQVRIWQMDEAHHVLSDNKWGRGVDKFPNAVGCGWSATLRRADRRGLGRSSHGVFDVIVRGQGARWLIDRGFLADYRIYAPSGDMDFSHVRVNASGDYDPGQLGEAAEKSHIVGDVVQHYLKHAAGKLGVTFAVNEQMAHEHVAAFQQAGVPAAFIGYKTKDRDKLIEAYARQDIKQLVNMDILGEGFDCAVMEVCSIGAPTLSYARWVQRFFRPLRPSPGKTHGIVIDHVDNWRTMVKLGYGLPDTEQDWTLEAPERRQVVDASGPPVRACVNPDCLRVFEGYSRKCTYCGHVPAIMQRDSIETVEGDLTELDPALLARLRKQSDHIVTPLKQDARWRMNPFALKAWDERAEAQHQLRDAISWWAGVRRDIYREDDSSSYIRFMRTFGMDVESAKMLPGPKAKKLHDKIWEEIANDPSILQ